MAKAPSIKKPVLHEPPPESAQVPENLTPTYESVEIEIVTVDPVTQEARELIAFVASGAIHVSVETAEDARAEILAELRNDPSPSVMPFGKTLVPVDSPMASMIRRKLTFV